MAGFKERIDFGVICSGEKSRRPDEFVTNSQIVAAQPITRTDTAGHDIEIGLEVSALDESKRLVARYRQISQNFSFTSFLRELKFDTKDFDSFTGAVDNSGAYTVFTAPTAGFYRIDVAIFGVLSGGNDVNLSLLYQVESPPDQFLADIVYELASLVLPANRFRLHGHTEMDMDEGAWLIILLQSDLIGPSIDYTGSLTIRYMRKR